MAAVQRAAASGAVIAFLCCWLSSCRQSLPPGQSYAAALADMRRGNLEHALQTATAAISSAQRSGDASWACRLQLLKVEILLLRFDVEGARRLLVAPLPADASPGCAAGKRMLEGRVLLAQGKLPAARTALDEAFERAQVAGEHEVLIDTEVLRGRLSRASGDLRGADAHYGESLRLAAARGDAVRQAAALSNLATVRIYRFRYDEALDLLEQAIAYAERGGARAIKAAALANFAVCQTRFGNFEQAVEAHEQAIEIQRSAGVRLAVVIGLAEIGTIRLYENRPQEAVSWFRQAVELASSGVANEYAVDMRARLASALLEMGRIGEAERETAAAAAIQAKLSMPAPLELELNPAEIACARGNCREAVRLLEARITRGGTPPILWRAHAALAHAYASLGDRAQARRHFETALAQIAQARAGLGRTDYKLGFLRHLIRFYREYVDYLVGEGDDARALKIVESSRAQLFAQRAESLETPDAALSVEELRRRASRHNAVLLSYWLAPQKSQLWVLTGRGLHRFELPGETEIATMVAAYRADMETRLRDPLAGEHDAGVQLYRLLIEPARHIIPSGARVVIAADGALHNLNFETLIVPGREPHYWIEDATVAVTPALRLLGSDRAASTAAVLAIGNPEQVDEEFPELPRSGDELEAIRGSFSDRRVVVKTGREATPAAWRRSGPEQFSMIHFATHAVASRESPLDSAIILSRENAVWKLYTREIAESQLRADLVTVSACRSAGARAYSGEGLVGFAWAFLHAGVRGVIAGMWNVSDRPTADLMANLYRALAAGEPPAVALRSAKLASIRAGGNLRKPYNWAAFQLYTRNLSHLRNIPARLKRPSS